MSSNPNLAFVRVLIQRLTALEAERARVLRHVSHELKTPLSALREGVALLGEEVPGPLTADQREVVGILGHNVALLQRQIEELLDYHATMLESARVQRRHIGLQELLNGVVDAQRLPLRARGLQVLVDCAGCERPLVIDPDLLRLVLGNLLSNAIIFSPDGGEIRLHAHACEGWLLLDCIDAGPGVAAADAERIFEPFEQGGGRPASAPRGSGVGLSIVRELVAAQGGRVYLVPSESGAHFRVELPYEE